MDGPVHDLELLLAIYWKAAKAEPPYRDSWHQSQDVVGAVVVGEGGELPLVVLVEAQAHSAADSVVVGKTYSRADSPGIFVRREHCSGKTYCLVLHPGIVALLQNFLTSLGTMVVMEQRRHWQNVQEPDWIA